MKYYCIKQHDITDCGAACLATICKQNGYKIGISKIIEIAGTDKQGTNVYGVIKAAEQLGFSAKGLKGDKKAFFSDFPLPCIAHVIVDGELLHYVVIHKITKHKVIIADPDVGIVKLKPEAFFGEEHERGIIPKYKWSGVLIILIKKETFKKGDETKGLFNRFFRLLIPQRKILLHVFIALNNQIEELEGNIEQLSAEKESTLNNLELQQITSIEQQITTINNNLITAKSNQTLVDAQLDTLNKDYNTDEISELKELQSVALELISYENKKAEYESILKQYDLESDYVKVLANNSGYIYLNQELNVGSYVTQGSTICRILSGNSDEVYAEIYVQNKDIAKLHEGQKVKFEIAAYPSSEYGYFNGVIDSIPKDIKVDGINGSAYYLVKVRCDNTTLTNKKGETGNIINGMACQAKIVVDEERILKYLLKKIDLTD